MSSINSQIFSAIAVTSENIPEANMDSIDATYETAGEGLFLLPSVLPEMPSEGIKNKPSAAVSVFAYMLNMFASGIFSEFVAIALNI